MNLMVALNIAKYYPNKILTMSICDEENYKWTAGVFSLNKDNTIGDMLYCFENYDYDNSEDAKLAIDLEIKKFMKIIKIMSN